MSSNALTFASKIRFLTGLEIEPIDSAEATTLITTTVDSAYVQLRSDAGGVDSASVSAIVTSTADSAYVQARQDFAYSSLTGTPTFDSAYVQARQDYSYASLTGAPNVLDSADITALIDGSTQVLDIADIVGATGNSGEYLKSLGDGSATWENITTVIDSAYVQARSSVDSASVTSLITTTVDSAYVVARAGGVGVDSAATQSLIDASIQVLDIADIVGATGNSGEYLKSLGDGSAAWENITTVIDSAYVQARSSAGGVDSASVSSLITTTVDSAYVASRVSTNVATLNIAPSAKYARLSLTSQQSLPSASTTVVTNFNTRVTDNTTNNLLTSTLGDGKFIIPAGVSKVKLKASLETASASDQIILQIQKNGSSLPGSTNFDIQSTGGDYVAGFTAILDVVENDYFQIAVYSATSATAEVDVNYSWFELEVIEGSILNQTVSTTIELEDLANVDSSSATQGQVLTWDSANSYWYASTLAAGTDSSSVVSIITTTVDSAYVQLRSGAGGLSPWVEKTSDYNLVAGDRIVVDTRDSAITLTLPASPSFSDEISIVDGTNYAATNNITVGGNGKKILASDSDFIINIDRASIEFMFYNDSQGWILTRTV